MFFGRKAASDEKAGTAGGEAARCPRTKHAYQRASPAERAAYKTFFLTHTYISFWGANDHLQMLIAAAHKAVPYAPNATLIDVGAAPYNVIGGDVSHYLEFVKRWGCPHGVGTIIGIEPMPASFANLRRAVNELQPLVEGKAAEAGHAAASGAPLRQRRPSCQVLLNKAASDKEAELAIAAQAWAGANTASLDGHFQHGRTHSVQTIMLDNELERRQLPREVLILKADVEGHEMAVLRGARKLMRDGKLHMAIVEYGDKASHPIWNAMKQQRKATPAAASPQLLAEAAGEGMTLWALQRWADELGYDTFFVGAFAQQPLLIPISRGYWDDRYELCRDKTSKWSRDGVHWANFSAWDPYWSAVCWYDVALILRSSPLFDKLVLNAAALPEEHCKRLKTGWYPHWVDEPAPLDVNLRCAPGGMAGGGICTLFVKSDDQHAS